MAAATSACLFFDPGRLHLGRLIITDLGLPGRLCWPYELHDVDAAISDRCVDGVPAQPPLAAAQVLEAEGSPFVLRKSGGAWCQRRPRCGHCGAADDVAGHCA